MSSTAITVVLSLACSSLALAQAPTAPSLELPRDAHWSGAADGKAQIGNGHVHAILAPGQAQVTGPTYGNDPRPLKWWVVDGHGNPQLGMQWRFHRPTGLPFVRLCGSAADRSIEVLWFCEAHTPRVWAVVTSTGPVELSLAAYDLASGSLPAIEGASVMRVDTSSGQVTTTSTAKASAAATAALRDWRLRSRTTLQIRSSDRRLEDLIEEWKVQLLSQQCAATGRIVPMMGSRTATPQNTTHAVLGLLRLGFFEEAGRALDAFVALAATTGSVPPQIDLSPTPTGQTTPWSDLKVTPDALWLVLAHHWHWRASGDTSRLRRHWGFLEAVVKRQQRRDGVLLGDEPDIGSSARFALCLQAMAAMRDALGTGTEAIPPGRAWLKSFGRRLGEIDTAFWDSAASGYREATESTAPVGSLAPAALGLFSGGGRFEQNAAAAVARYSGSALPTVLGQLVHVHGQRKDAGRSAVLRRLIDGVRPGGDWDTPAPFDPGTGGHNLDALLFGLTGARTTAWGAPPARILPLTLFLPEFVTWFEVRNLARDGWRVDLSIGAEHRALTPAEYDALQTHPVFGDSKPSDEHDLFAFEVRLLSDDPPAGAWQASVSVAGTSFQRYLSGRSPVSEVEVWDGGERQPWPSARRR